MSLQRQIRADRLRLEAELKRETKQPSQAQLDWLAALEAAGVEAYIWRPSDWREGRIARVLGR